MKIKKNIYFIILAMIGLLLMILTLISTIKYQSRFRMEQFMQNVFDEMVVNKCEGLRNASNIKILDNSYPDIYISMCYKYETANVSGNLKKYFGNASKLSMDSALYISFDILDEEKDYKGNIFFAYNEYLKKLYIYGNGNSIPLTELEEYRNYLLHDVIIGSWIKNGDSHYTIDDPGEFEIVDYLLPYEYCGEIKSEAEQTVLGYTKGYQGNFKGTESYTIWLENEELLCVQQKIEYENKSWHGTIYPNIPEKLWIDVFGLDVGSSRFAVQRRTNGGICNLTDLVRMDDGFITWIKDSGQALGNLQKISANREEGYKNTQLMLQNCPEESVKAALEQCEFYIEPGYLHVRFPYWDYKSENPGWVKNGNELWKGWLTMETGDIEEFLKVEKW